MASNKPKGTPAQTRRHRYWMAVIGALLAIALGGATGCEAAQKAQDQDTTRKVENGIDTAQDLQKAIENGDVNALKRLAGDKFAERDIALSNNAVCDLSDKTRLTITKAPGWQDGPYKSYVLYSQTANGTYGPLPASIMQDGLVNNKPAGNPLDTWQWHCSEGNGIPDDPAGFYKLRIFSTGSNLGQVSEEVVWETRP